jgi:uncharacterized protein YcnI
MVIRTGRIVALGAVATIGLPASVAAFATIPQDEVFAREGRRERVDIRIQEGCDSVATDRVEVEIPEGVVAVVPQAVPGWTASIEMVETDPYELFGQRRTERVSRVTWTGGPLAPDAFQDFGLSAVFTQPTDELIIPVVQACGLEERSWEQVPDEGQARSDLAFPAPFVRVVAPPALTLEELGEELRELRRAQETLRTDLDDLRLGEIAGSRLRDRLRDLERRLADAEGRLEQVEEADPGTP